MSHQDYFATADRRMTVPAYACPERWSTLWWLLVPTAGDVGFVLGPYWWSAVGGQLDVCQSGSPKACVVFWLDAVEAVSAWSGMVEVSVGGHRYSRAWREMKAVEDRLPRHPAVVHLRIRDWMTLG